MILEAPVVFYFYFFFFCFFVFFASRSFLQISVILGFCASAFRCDRISGSGILRKRKWQGNSSSEATGNAYVSYLISSWFVFNSILSLYCRCSAACLIWLLPYVLLDLKSGVCLLFQAIWFKCFWILILIWWTYGKHSFLYWFLDVLTTFRILWLFRSECGRYNWCVYALNFGVGDLEYWIVFDWTNNLVDLMKNFTEWNDRGGEENCRHVEWSRNSFWRCCGYGCKTCLVFRFMTVDVSCNMVYEDLSSDWLGL